MMKFDKGFADGQTEAEAPGFAVCGSASAGLFEGIKDAQEGVGFDADAGVGDFNTDDRGAGIGGSGVVGGSDGDRAAGVGKFNGVLEEVPEDLLEAEGIGVDEVRGSIEFNAKPGAVGEDFFAGDKECVADDAMQVGGFEVEIEFAGDDTIEIEKVIDEAGFEFDVATDGGEFLTGGLGEGDVFFESAGGDEDGRERGAELVAEDGEETILRGGSGVSALALGAGFGDILAEDGETAVTGGPGADFEPGIERGVGAVELSGGAGRHGVKEMGLDGGADEFGDGGEKSFPDQGIDDFGVVGVARGGGFDAPARINHDHQVIGQVGTRRGRVLLRRRRM